jgi:hypothetical protein
MHACIHACKCLHEEVYIHYEKNYACMHAEGKSTLAETRRFREGAYMYTYVQTYIQVALRQDNRRLREEAANSTETILKVKELEEETARLQRAFESERKLSSDHAGTCVCVYIYIHMHTHTHTYIHTYIHTSGK